MTPKINFRSPTVSEYMSSENLPVGLFSSCPLQPKAWHSQIFSGVITNDDGVVIGMGRIIDDGAIYLHIQDVIVHPEFQRKGIGKLIMDELLKHAEKLGGKHTNIGLMCSKGREKFSRQFGFIDRPNEKFGTGMIKIKE
jgi:ribosomal protein S18 acetylase RimI-like enzyme